MNSAQAEVSQISAATPLARLDRRSAGILLHLSSLPGPHGIGDLGPAAFRFVDFLHESGQHWWQMLPVVPAGPGDSPYSSPSVFAGNPLFISLELLVQDGLLSPEDLAAAPNFSSARTDYDAAREFKENVLRKAFARFSEKGSAEEWEKFRAFCVEESDWLDDHGFFCALKKIGGGQPWLEWDEALKRRRFRFWPREISRQAGEDSAFHQFAQYLFRKQWLGLKIYAAERGVGLIGDVPLYVAFESADVWAHPEIFRLNADLRPEAVAGVPPDYFSQDGQLWGNPLYRWDALAADGYAWWAARLSGAAKLFDAVRLDHFIGFCRYWEIPADSKTARSGRWVQGPGEDFFAAIVKKLPGLQIIAEDLGILGPEVTRARDAFGFPGIKVLQFSFDGSGRASDPPQAYPAASLACTGTHDNDTVLSWLAGRQDRDFLMKYLGADPAKPQWALIKAVYDCPARTAIIPLQDALGLGSEARMNRPGTPSGNWLWRLDGAALTPELSRTLAELTRSSGR